MNCLKKTADEINCQVHLLDGKVLNVDIQGYVKGSDLLDKVFEHLKLAETDCFSLCYKDRNNITQWLQPARSLNKQIQNISSPTLYFGVKFYLEDPCQLKEEVTRYQFFLQLKQDLLNGKIPSSTKTAAVLASLCVQSELGDYDDSLHTEGYISEFRFIPNQAEEFEKHVCELHKTLRGMTPSKAETKFLEKVQRLEMYGVDLHRVNHSSSAEYYLGLTPTGISIYQNKNKVAHYFWPKITKVEYEGKKFMLAVQKKYGVDLEYSYHLDTKDACRRLWTSCGERHAFFRLPSFKSTTFRDSGRTKQEALELSSSLRRQQPKVERAASKRFSRRLSSLCDDAVEDEDIILRSGRDSLASAYSTSSLPWETANSMNGHHGGLYSSTNGIHESGRSRKRKPPSHSSRMYHSDKSGDESESGFATRYRRNTSLTELSDAGFDEYRDRRRKKRERKRSRGVGGGETSGSEAENDVHGRMPQFRDESRLSNTPGTTSIDEPDSVFIDSMNGMNQSQEGSFMKRSPATYKLSLYQADRTPAERDLSVGLSRGGYDSKPPMVPAGDSRHSLGFEVSQVRTEPGQRSDDGVLAMQVLQQELEKLGRRSARGHNSKMSLTPREMQRVSRLYGDNRHIITEL